MTPERLVAYVLGTHALEGVFFSPEFKEKLMKYAVIRSRLKTQTLSEYCTERGFAIEVREVPPSCWRADVTSPQHMTIRGPVHTTIDRAIDGLCHYMSTSELVIIPGSDLEAAE